MDCGQREAIAGYYRRLKHLPASVLGEVFVGFSAGRSDSSTGGGMEDGRARVTVESERCELPSWVGQLQLGDHETHEILPAGVVPVAGYGA